MDNFFMEHVKQDTPKMNPDVLNGLAVKMFPKAISHLDSIIRSVAKDFIPGLKYQRIELCAPEEELRKVNSKKNDKFVVETAKSSIFLCKLIFTYNDPRAVDLRTGEYINQDVELDPCYVYLPYVGEAGLIFISCARYFASPIHADVVLSFERDCVFLNLLRAKFSIRDIRHTVLNNGIYEEHKVLWSTIYHVDASETTDKVTTKPLSTLAHYLFGYKGLYNTFLEFGKCTPVVGTQDINRDTYPSNEWNIYESSRPKLRGSRGQIYSPIKMAIRKSEVNNTVEGLVVAFFYALDHFPDFFAKADWVDDKIKWRFMLGLVIFGKSRNAGNLIEMIDDHFKSLDQYLDTLVKYKLESIGIYVNDIYQFFAYAIQNYNEWSIKSKENLNSLYDKELSILHYTHSTIVKSINTLYFKMRPASKSSDKRPPTREELNKLIRAVIKPRQVFSIKDAPSALSTMSYSGDNKFIKITSNLIPQRSLSSVGGEDIDIYDPVNRHHPSFMAIGSHMNLPKSSPIGYKTISPYVQLNHDNMFVFDPVEKEFLDHIHEITRRK